jgi:regulator of chromosome condensation
MLIPGLTNIVRISIGENYALALDKKGQAYSWGNDEQHQLGHRVLSRGGHSTLLPSPIGLRDIISIHAGPNHAFAISKSGAVWAWGSNHAGQTGITRGAGDTGAIVFPPKQVRTLSKKQITMLDGGSDHSIGLTEDGKCLVWGSMTGYQTGLDLSKMSGEPGILFDSRGKPDILLQPTALPIPKCSFVCAGAQHSLAITTDGKAYSWGFNQDGQCGQGPEEAIEVATLIDSNAVRGKKFSWAAGGGQFSLLAGPLEGNTQPLTNGVPNGVH